MILLNDSMQVLTNERYLMSDYLVNSGSRQKRKICFIFLMIHTGIKMGYPKPDLVVFCLYDVIFLDS